MKTMQTISLLAIVFSCLKLTAQETLSLEQCYQMAEKSFPTAKQAQLQAALSQAKIKNIQNDWLPGLDLNAQATYQSDVTKIEMNIPIPGLNLELPDPRKDQYKITADISQMVYDGGIIRARKKTEEAIGIINQETIKTDLFALREKINQQYFYILMLQENKKQLELVKKELESKLSTMRSAIQNGMALASGADVLEVEILKTAQQIKSFDNEQTAALWNLAIFTGNETILTANLSIPAVADSLLQGNQRPEQLLFDARKSQTLASMHISKAGRRPKLMAFAQAGYGNPGLNMMSDEFDSFYIVGAKLNWKLWDWNETKNEHQQLAIQGEIIENQREIFNKNLSLAEVRLRSKIEQLEQMLATDKQIMELRKAICSRSSSALENGTITSSDYVSDLTAESQAIINQQIHLIQLAEAKTNLKTLLGK